jgi:DNA (cytosine-5)-methyltransferase 1
MPVKYSEIRKKLKIDNEKKVTSEGLAHLTHYFQNHKNGVSEYFKPSAEEYLAELHQKLNIIEEPDFQYYLPIKWDIPFPPPTNPKFKFIDLFAGIGGIRLAYQNLGGKCVFTSEWNEQAKRTYEANFGEVPSGDENKGSVLGVPLRVGLSATSPAQKPVHKTFTGLAASIPHAISTVA